MSLWIRLCNHTYIHTYIQLTVHVVSTRLHASSLPVAVLDAKRVNGQHHNVED